MITTDVAIKKLKAPEGGRLEIRDKVIPGLYLRVSKTGRTWYLRGRPQGEKNPVAMKIGPYGDGTDALSLKEARLKAIDWKDAIKAGDDPREEGKQKKQRADDTFGSVVDRFLKSHGRKLKPNTQKQYESILQGGDVKPLVKKPVNKITKRQVAEIIENIADSGRLIQANRTLAILKKFFNWCADDADIIKENEPIPTDRIKPVAKEKARGKVLSPDELKVVWRAAVKEGWPFGHHTRLLITTAQRQSEVASIGRKSIADDIWKQDENKADRPHELPLNQLSLDILSDCEVMHPDLYFSTNGETPISGFSKAKRRLDQTIKKICEEEELDLFSEPWRTHDLRRTATTMMRKLGVPQDVCSRILNHAQKGVTAKVYDTHDMLHEKVEAMNVWNDYLQELFRDEQD